MKAIYDVSASKRPVNLSLNEDLVAKARRLTDNLSAEVETLLAEYVARQQRVRDEHAEGLRRTAAAWSAFSARHGSFADEFSEL
ncbi:type II toxin-antitoxin system CcdA family antitoxin [Luteimonas huabeiensis]|uniref:type II toxin-antitoxin system CcdA family antitoxin n=1 Tax=Luteimonas huabeiensis TaxID=1244513 RepID=UPI000463246C|nr:type II toxin-antitoxin system CcdA family antitoxin [Luteimonas huabeiensis]